MADSERTEQMLRTVVKNNFFILLKHLMWLILICLFNACLFDLTLQKYSFRATCQREKS